MALVNQAVNAFKTHLELMSELDKQEADSSSDSWELTKVVRQNTATLLHAEVAGLPSEMEPEAEETKRFDLLVLSLQLSLIRSEPRFGRLRDQVKGLMDLLEDKERDPESKSGSQEWGWRESNSHALRRQILSLVRLPFRHIPGKFRRILSYRAGVALSG